jgi:hypothetical protein
MLAMLLACAPTPHPHVQGVTDNTPALVGWDAPEEPWVALCDAGAAAVIDDHGYPTIQGALDTGAASVSVCPGTWTEALTISHSVTLSGTGAAAETVLSGDGTHRVVQLNAGEHTLSHLTITDGWTATDGAGIRSRGDALTLDDVIVHSNRAEWAGAGLDVATAGPITLLNAVFHGNIAGAQGGAVKVVPLADTDLVVIGGRFVGNWSEGNAGAVAIETISVDLDAHFIETAFVDNGAFEHGGAVQMTSAWGVGGGGLVFEDSAVIRNRSAARPSAAVEVDAHSVDSANTDWGADDDDNGPQDVRSADGTVVSVDGVGALTL